MKVAREAQYRVQNGEELSLADLGLLVAHLQTVGQAPPTARVLLRVDMLRIEWETEQETQQELDVRLEAERAERQRAREEASMPQAATSMDEDPYGGQYVPAEEDPIVPTEGVGRRRRAS